MAAKSSPITISPSFEEVLTDAASNGARSQRHPEYQALSGKVISLYKEITEKALANESAG